MNSSRIHLANGISSILCYVIAVSNGLSEKGIINVLHIDEDKELLDVTNKILCLLGNFEIDSAHSFEEAKEKLKTKQYDAIVSEYVVGEKKSLDFLKQLRENKIGTPLIMFSYNDEIIAEALKLGVKKFIGKFGNAEKVFNDLSNEIKKCNKKD
jgi:DNA-binding NtrC family response regulator